MKLVTRTKCGEDEVVGPNEFSTVLGTVANGPFDSPDDDLVRAAAHLGQVVVDLYAQPGFSAAAERMGKPHRHLWRNTALAVE